MYPLCKYVVELRSRYLPCPGRTIGKLLAEVIFADIFPSQKNCSCFDLVALRIDSIEQLRVRQHIIADRQQAFTDHKTWKLGALEDCDIKSRRFEQRRINRARRSRSNRGWMNSSNALKMINLMKL